jgi:hypothetical protein
LAISQYRYADLSVRMHSFKQQMMKICPLEAAFNNCRLIVLRVLCDARGGSDDIGECHADPVLWPQDDHRASFDHLIRRQLKIIFSEQIAQNHKDL